jgi:hypothetical protein
VGEHLLWLSIDGFDRSSVAGSLDPTHPNFALAWREFRGRRRSPLWKALSDDDVEGLRRQLFAANDPDFNEAFRVVSVGGDVWEPSIGDGRKLSILAVAAQFGAVHCAQFLLAKGARVGAAEVGAAFIGGNAGLMRVLWDAFPSASALELAFASVKSWNVSGLRWLLDSKISVLSPSDLVRLFERACSSGSYSCRSCVFNISASTKSQLRLVRPFGVVGGSCAADSRR